MAVSRWPGGVARLHEIDLTALPGDFRLQRFLFAAAGRAFGELQGSFKGERHYLAVQLIRLCEQFVASDKLVIPSLFHQSPERKRVLLALNVDLIVQHLLRHVTEQNIERLEPVFDAERPIGSTREMRTLYSTKPNQPTLRSQISHVVGDSSWELYTANLLEKHPQVVAWAKNDHLGFEVFYLWNGARRRFVPDFLIRFASGKTLVLEIKGEDSPQNKAKRTALAAWVDAVNARGGFGRWACDVALQAGQVQDILARHAAG